MNENGTLFLTHIRKTAGTAVRKAIFDPYVPKSKQHRPNGYRTAISAQGPFDLVEGHFPYGIHYFYGVKKPRYYVMLRHPVDRVLSCYYFIRACSGPSYEHPRLNEVRENSIVEFCKNPVHQNVQTRFVAGILPEYAGRYLSLSGRLGTAVLKRAKQNLTEQYEAFGLKESFEDSVRMFAEQLGVEPKWPEKQYKTSGKRPRVGDLDIPVRRALRRLNSLDVALYQFAQEQFARKAEKL